jgi:hypothetical protein
MNSKAEVLAYISAQVLSGVNNHNSAALIRSVLNYMVNREYELTEIPVTKAGYSSTDLDGLIDEIIDDIADGMSASDIRDALETLTSTSRLDKTAVEGAEAALNRRGAGDVEGATYQLGMTNIKAGDFWVNDLSGGSPAEGAEVAEGLCVVALVDSPEAFDYTDDSEWWIGNFKALTAAETAALLNTISTVADMVTANRISYDETTVKLTLDAMATTLGNTQTAVKKKRVVCSNVTPATTLTVAGISTVVIQMAINRVPYQGIEADDFEGTANGYDFIYEYSGSNVIITLAPGLGISFEYGMIVDILH